MKKVIVAAVLLGLLAATFLLAACGGNSVPAGAIATVGDATVTQEQFDQIWAQAKAQYASSEGAPPFPKEGTADYDRIKASIINYLVQNELIKQQAADMNVSVTDKELNDSLAQIIKSPQVGSQKKLEALMKKYGMTMDQLKTQQMATLLQGKVQAKVGADAKVPEEQIKAYFDDPKNKSQFVVPDAVDARHVLVAAKADAEKVQQLLTADPSDANWKKVAKKYSIDPGTKDKGGALGSFPEGRMVPEFDKVAFSIKPGTISVPVKSQFGWHVIEVTKKTPGSTKTFAEAKSMIEQSLKFQLQTKAWTDWLAKVTKDAGILYAAGFDPKTLTASPSPSGSPAPASPAPSPTS
jgi:foldase protein PrsA